MKKNMFIEDIKADIVDRLENLIGTSEYVSDIGFKLTEAENINGSWYCSTFEAKEDIKNNFDIFEAAAEYMHSSWDDSTNPFLEPGLFHVKAMIAIYCSVFCSAISALDCWDDKIEIDADFIKAVKNGLDKINDIDDIF